MNYPLLSEYVESIRSAEDNLAELNYLCPVLDADGNPIMTGGNFAVVFKMQDKNTGKYYALKCFTKEQEGRAESYKMIAEELDNVNTTYFTHFKYYDKELFVDCGNSDETEFPVVLMDWVEGLTLDKFIQKYVHRYQIAENLDEVIESQEKAIELLANGYELNNIAYQFSCLAMWLLQQPFAHGDLKPDNIIVKEDRALVLVDYDGMYVPSMKGQKARELGSPDFRHPLRKEDDFDEHIDDFPLSSILLSLLAIANEPSLFEKYGSDGRLLFSEKDYCNLAGSKVLDALKIQMNDKDLTKYLSLFYLCCSQKFLFKESYHLFALPEPVKPSFMVEDENLSTKVTEEDLANAWTDEFGVKYSADRKRLLLVPEEIELKNYSIVEGTIVICDCSFLNKTAIENIYVPDSVKMIGYAAFSCCEQLSVNMPGKLKIIGDYAFCGCKRLDSVYIPQSVVKIGEGAFSSCEGIISIVVDKNNTFFDSRNNCNAIINKEIGLLIAGCSNTVIPNGISIIGKNAFSGCTNLVSISFPDSIVEIEDEAFVGCTNLKSLNIPGSLETIGFDVFGDCNGITSIVVDSNNKRYDSRNNCNAIVDTASNSLVVGCLNTIIPHDIKTLEDFAFSGCYGLKEIIIPQCVQEIGNGVFINCINLTSIDIPNNVKRLGKSVFRGCKSLVNISLPISMIEIGEFAFSKCEKLQSLTIPAGLGKIEGWLFDGCSALSSIAIPSSIKEIGFCAFNGCTCLVSIVIPDSVNKIGASAFKGCSNLKKITIPNNVLNIGGGAFYGCRSLSSVYLSKNLTSINYDLFYGCKKLNVICIPPKVKDIGFHSFSFCNIVSIIIPKSVSFIDKKAFWCCSGLNSIIVDAGNTIYDSRDNCNAIVETRNGTLILGCINTVIPEGVKFIGEKAFYFCYGLESITIPNGVFRIQDYSFGRFLRKIRILNALIVIDTNAFRDCTYLDTIFIPAKSKQRFSKMLPEYKDKLVELNN